MFINRFISGAAITGKETLKVTHSTKVLTINFNFLFKNIPPNI